MIGVTNDNIHTTINSLMATFRQPFLVLPRKDDFVVTTKTVVIVFGRIRGVSVNEVSGFRALNSFYEVSNLELSVLKRSGCAA
jgi:hypothetical protein